MCLSKAFNHVRVCVCELVGLVLTFQILFVMELSLNICSLTTTTDDIPALK